MPLNIKKDYTFLPSPVGAVRMISRSSRRSRLWAGGSFWRSIARGEGENRIQISCVEDFSDTENPQGLLVVHHTGLKQDEMLSVQNMTAPSFSLFDVKLLWDEEIKVTKEGDRLVARKYGIRWQIDGGIKYTVELGQVSPGRLFIAEGVTFKLDTNVSDWPAGGTLFLKPRHRRYPLVLTEVTNPEQATSTKGWDIDALRATLNGSDPWVTMPARPQVELVTTTSTSGGSSGSGDGGSSTPPTTTTTTQVVHHYDGPHEDGTDTGEDDFFLSAFGPTNMGGGDGLPANPVGLNTGPDRVLVHLNYSELDDGSQGELNQVFEWVGETAASGSWQRYA